MNEHEKKELLEFINNVLVELGNINNKQKGNQKPFLKFCCYEEDKGYAYFYQRKFEKTFNTSGYELKGFNIVSDEEESKSEKTDKKDIIKVLDSIVKDDEIRAKINIGMCASKDFRGRPYKVPINGKTFLGLFEKLYTDAANVKKIKNIPVFKKEEEINKINSIINFLIEDIIINKYLKFCSNIKKIELAIALLKEMSNVVKENKYMNLTKDRQEFLREFLIFDENESQKFDKIIEHNDELFKSMANDEEVEDVTTPQFIQNINDQIFDLKEKKHTCIDYFKHINSFFDGNNKELLAVRLRRVKKENYEEDIKYVLEKLLYQNPKHEQFNDLIKPTIGIITPKTKRTIQKPETFEDILEIFDCYDEILSYKGYEGSKYSNMIFDILEEMAKKIKETYNNAVEIDKKTSVALSELENVERSIKNGKKIKLKDKDAYVESSFGIVNSEADRMKLVALNQIRAFEKYNNRLSEIISKRKPARRIRTDIVKNLEKNGIEISSMSLGIEVGKHKDDKEFLLVLESVMDKEAEKYDGENVDYYHDLCRLSFECTKHIKKYSGMSYSDGEDLRDEINRFNCI